MGIGVPTVFLAGCVCASASGWHLPTSLLLAPGAIQRPLEKTLQKSGNKGILKVSEGFWSATGQKLHVSVGEGQSVFLAPGRKWARM